MPKRASNTVAGSSELECEEYDQPEEGCPSDTGLQITSSASSSKSKELFHFTTSFSRLGAFLCDNANLVSFRMKHKVTGHSMDDMLLIKNCRGDSDIQYKS